MRASLNRKFVHIRWEAFETPKPKLEIRWLEGDLDVMGLVLPHIAEGRFVVPKVNDG
jgi:hypothetical protein